MINVDFSIEKKVETLENIIYANSNKRCMNHPILVVAALIFKEDKILITKRKTGEWEFPGGKVEYQEAPKDAIRREITEELGIQLKNVRFFDYVSQIYNNGKHIVLMGFLASGFKGEISNIEVYDHKWVLVHELENFDLLDADIKFARKLKRIL